jgi:hypothetical protein
MMIVFLISVMEKKHIALAMQSRYSNFFFFFFCGFLYFIIIVFFISKANQLIHLNLSSTTLLVFFKGTFWWVRVFLLSQKEKKKEIHIYKLSRLKFYESKSYCVLNLQIKNDDDDDEQWLQEALASLVYVPPYIAGWLVIWTTD